MHQIISGNDQLTTTDEEAVQAPLGKFFSSDFVNETDDRDTQAKNKISDEGECWNTSIDEDRLYSDDQTNTAKGR